MFEPIFAGLAAAQHQANAQNQMQGLQANQLGQAGILGYANGGGGGGVGWHYGSTASSNILQLPTRRTLPEAKAFAAIKRCLRTEYAPALDKRKGVTLALLKQAKENGQTALFEELSRRISMADTEEKLIKAGFGTYINQRAVTGFSGRTRGATNITALENFGRPIPEAAAAKLRVARKSGLFQTFMVLHAGVAMIKTSAQKIREKDPIIFATVNGQPDRLYFICDWIDELCNLTLSELLVKEDFTGSLQIADGALDESALEEIKADAAKRDQMLAETKASNFRELEKKARDMEAKPLFTVKPWIKNLFS